MKILIGLSLFVIANGAQHCPRFPFQLEPVDYEMLASLITHASWGKNVQFRSVHQIEEPIGQGSLDPLMISKKGQFNTSKVAIAIAQVLPSGQVCFANRKIGSNQLALSDLKSITNAFIKLMNHKYSNIDFSFSYLY